MLFQCVNCGRDLLTKKCQCGQETPQHVIDFVAPPPEQLEFDWRADVLNRPDDP